MVHTRLEGQWLDIQDSNLCTLFLEQEGEEFSHAITTSSDYDYLLVPFMLRPIPIIQRSCTEEVVEPSKDTEIDKDLEPSERKFMTHGEASTTLCIMAEKVNRQGKTRIQGSIVEEAKEDIGGQALIMELVSISLPFAGFEVIWIPSLGSQPFLTGMFEP